MQLGAAPGLGRLQLGDPPRLLLGDVALPALFGGQRLLFVAAPHPQDLVAVVALLLLGQRLVRLALRRELHRLLVARGGDRLLVLLAELGHLVRQPLARLRLLLGEAPLQRLDLAPVRGVETRQLRLCAAPFRGGHRLTMLVGQTGRLGAVGLFLLAEPGLHLAAQPIGLARAPAPRLEPRAS